MHQPHHLQKLLITRLFRFPRYGFQASRYAREQSFRLPLATGYLMVIDMIKDLLQAHKAPVEILRMPMWSYRMVP